MRRTIWLGIVWIMMVLAISSQACAKVQTNTEILTMNGLQIVYPNIQYLKVAHNYTLNIHVYNSSNVPSGNLPYSIDCLLHLYNNTGKHLIRSYMPYNSVDKDYEFLLNDSVLSTVGEYDYVIQCNGTESGYLARDIYVSADGHAPPDLILICFIILLPMIVGMAMMLSSPNIKEDYWHLKLLTFLMGLASPGISSLIASMAISRYYLFDELAVWIMNYGFACGLIFMFVAGYIIIKIFQYSFENRNKPSRDEEMRTY